ncbi:hypothetical protein DIPPA_25438 [Diplonema papillatum]|nr:hypothetical protein DIPPA_25438 [Diplonema papillatum]
MLSQTDDERVLKQVCDKVGVVVQRIYVQAPKGAKRCDPGEHPFPGAPATCVCCLSSENVRGVGFRFVVTVTDMRERLYQNTYTEADLNAVRGGVPLYKFVHLLKFRLMRDAYHVSLTWHREYTCRVVGCGKAFESFEELSNHIDFSHAGGRQPLQLRPLRAFVRFADDARFELFSRDSKDALLELRQFVSSHLLPGGGAPPPPPPPPLLLGQEPPAARSGEAAAAAVSGPNKVVTPPPSPPAFRVREHWVQQPSYSYMSAGK